VGFRATIGQIAASKQLTSISQLVFPLEWTVDHRLIVVVQVNAVVAVFVVTSSHQCIVALIDNNKLEMKSEINTMKGCLLQDV
jgi:hypothetical protein